MRVLKPQPIYRASAFKRETSSVIWQQAIASLPSPHPLQSWTWAEFKSRWGWQPIPLLLTVAESRWEPLAAAMVLKRKLPRLPFSVLYVPRGPLLDYSDGALRRVVLAELERVARREKAIFIKIDPEVPRSYGYDPERPSPTGAQVIRDLQAHGWQFSREQIQFRNTVVLDITRPEDEILAAMKQKTRYNIRLAARKGVVVRAGTPDDFPVIAAMYRETAERDGFAIRPLAYYLDAWQSMFQAGMAQPLLAEYENKPIAAVVLVRFGKRAIYMYGASTNEERQRMPNYLLQWEAIRWAKAQGCETYDFWGAPDNFVETDRMWGVWRFKAGFNGQVVQHIGAWDYVIRPFWYWFYSVAIPKYLNLLRQQQKPK
ncbi:MAG: peptidoglycan bridge formation glycyltransferase FemA/FemB family protein [Chloroflexi bacterium]|nr:MAG: peptidoglycan bridge formation glycyltransferase FemA/FemB family protein [Chloroflexota bacterium]